MPRTRTPQSDLAIITVRPSELLCAMCTAGGCPSPPAGLERVREIVGAMKQDRWGRVKLQADLALTLVHYEDAYRDCTPQAVPADFQERRADFAARLRDLTILRLLGLQPGDERCAFDLVRLLLRNIESLDGICRSSHDTSAAWAECLHARSGFFERARQGRLASASSTAPVDPTTIFLTPRDDQEMALCKARSGAAVEKADHLYIRPQHLMCIACYYGSGKEEPLSEDNLYEIRLKMEQSPDIPVTLVEGNCMVCDPCPYLELERNVCLHAHVRDPLRDLLILQRMGLKPGETLPAREIYRLLFSKISTAHDICSWGDKRNVTNEWLCCGGATSGNYERAIERDLLGAAPK